jgi:hypothetical protein
MFFEGVLTPGKRAAVAAPAERAHTSDSAMNRPMADHILYLPGEMASHEILVWSDYI